MFVFFFFKQKTAYEMRISDWSSDVCSSDLQEDGIHLDAVGPVAPFLRALDVGGLGALGELHRDIGRRLAELAGVLPDADRLHALGNPIERGVIAVLAGHRQALQALRPQRSEEQTSELQSLQRISYAGFCLK